MQLFNRYCELVNYRLTEVDRFTWTCFGDTAYYFSNWDQDNDTYSLQAIVDLRTFDVKVLEVCDYRNNRAYRYFAPGCRDPYRASGEPEYRDIAWDDVGFTDLETEDDWFDKAEAIFQGRDYDNRVSVPLELEEAEVFELMKLAHEQDITLNKLVEQILQQVIDRGQNSKTDIDL